MSTDPTPIPAYGEHVPRTVEHWVMCAVCDDDWPCGTAMAFAAGLAAGRTRSGCCQAAVDSDGHTHADTCVYLLGLREGRAEGRTAAAADIRAEIVDEPTHENLRMMNAAFQLAARVAENGANRPVERTAVVALDCAGCGDTIWPTERVYEFGDGRVRCTICQVNAPSRGADR